MGPVIPGWTGPSSPPASPPSRARDDDDEEEAGPGNATALVRVKVDQVREMTDSMLLKFYQEATGTAPAHERKQAAKGYGAILEKWLVLEGRPTQIVGVQGEETPALLELARRVAVALGCSPDDENVR